jgi:protein phosphatase methylesterase 1
MGPPGKIESDSVCYDPIPWNEFFESTEKMDGRIPIYYSGDEGVLFVCMHGAGHSAHSFGLLARELKKLHFRVAAFEWRGHGENNSENESEMSEENLIREACEVMEYLANKFADTTIILVGHSMGGAIAAKTAHRILTNFTDYTCSNQIKGVYVIDTVEGTAIEALPFMESII